jgi:ubiquinone/menaquinone biosynthesis C-methylase UbiE
MRYWNLNDRNETERYVYIYRELGAGFSGSIVDIGCGSGTIISKLQEKYPEAQCIGVDIDTHSLWIESKAKMIQMDIMDFIKQDNKYDVVLMLNSFRNWNSPERLVFTEWLDKHADKFITSTNLPYRKTVIGKDYHNVDLESYEINKRLWRNLL